MSSKKSGIQKFKDFEYSISLPLAYVGNAKSGVASVLQSMLMWYDDVFKGVILRISRVRLLGNIGSHVPNSDIFQCVVKANFDVLKPNVGDKLTGIISSVGPEYIAVDIQSVATAMISRPDYSQGFNPESYEVGDVLNFEVTEFYGSSLGVISFKGALRD